jgi:hypothetical protein
MATDPAVAKFPELQAEANKKLVQAIEAVNKAILAEIDADQKLSKEVTDRNKEWLRLEKQRVDQYRRDQTEKAKLDTDDFKAAHQHDVNYLAEFQAFTANILATWKGTLAAKEAYSLAAHKQELAIMESQAQELDSLTASSITTLGNYFKIGKALSIAQAIINTYAGATKALEQGGIYGVPLAAIVIAAGLANVATIAAQDPSANQSGSFTGPQGGFGGVTGHAGFDDPANDFAAVVGGRKWARDMVGYFSRGASQGFAQELTGSGGGGPGGPSSYDQRRTYNQHTSVHFSGPYLDSGDDVAMRKIYKKIAYAQRLDGRRTAR